jgi:hypothetical protein
MRERNAAIDIARSREIGTVRPSVEQTPDEIPVIGGDAYLDALRNADLQAFREIQAASPLTEAFRGSAAFNEAAKTCALRCLDGLRINDALWMKQSGVFDPELFEDGEIADEMKRVAFRDPVGITNDPRYRELIPQSVIESAEFKLLLEKFAGEERDYHDVLHGRRELPRIPSHEGIAGELESSTDDPRFARSSR